MKIFFLAISLCISLCGFCALPVVAQEPIVQDAVVKTADTGDLKKLAEDAAVANDLPAEYFVRLIRQESGFQTGVTSDAGAQGIAQFMPATARDYGVKDPFDATEALPKSARLLHDLKAEFGNLGLAAAAYNAGPKRVHEWLEGRLYLPMETLSYVYAITGRAADDWAPAGSHPLKGVAPYIGFHSTLDARKNWELALLLSISAADAPKLLTSSATASKTAQMGSARKYQAVLRANPEASLCSSCIIQKFY